ncbi:MAG: hypothetical protein MK074_01815 [Phycisphaerales bacterium]|nr:hypothetical protein [Phycisphaerales bacterium]
MTHPDDTGTPALSPADRAAIDHLAEAGFNEDQLHGLDGDALTRAHAAHSLLGNLNSYPDGELSEDDRTTLVHATMARIRREEDMQHQRMRLQPDDASGRGSRMRFRLAEFGAVGAVAAMVAGAAVPMAHMAKERAVSLGTHRNLSAQHAGITSWATANNGRLPSRAVSEGVSDLTGTAATQLDIGAVIDHGHCHKGTLQNPRRPGTGVHGFSVIVMPISGGFFGDAELVLVGDRNPALEGLLDGQSFDEAISQQRFRRRLTDHPAVLFGDGRVIDARNGTVKGDHVWNVDRSGAIEQDVLLVH